jgi:hypothetical protein
MAVRDYQSVDLERENAELRRLMVRLEEVGDLALKGLMQAVAVYSVAHEP